MRSVEDGDGAGQNLAVGADGPDVDDVAALVQPDQSVEFASPVNRHAHTVYRYQGIAANLRCALWVSLTVAL